MNIHDPNKVYVFSICLWYMFGLCMVYVLVWFIVYVYVFSKKVYVFTIFIENQQ